MNKGNIIDYKLFTGNAHPELAREISDILKKPLAKATVKKFSDGEVFTCLEETVRGYDCFIIQPTCGPVNDNLMEICVMIDAMKRSSAARINVVMPYYGYARQDRQAHPREPITSKIVADILTSVGADRVITMDLHAAQITGYYNIPVDHLYGMPVLAEYFLKNPVEDLVIVSPDHGSVGRARKFAHYFDAPIAIIDKRRPRPNVSEVMNIIGDIKGKNCIMIDDMVDTAGTLCNAAAALVKNGAKSVRACATHGVLSGPAVDNIRGSVIKELVLLNTMPVPEEKRIDKIKVLSVAPLFADCIRRVYNSQPVSPIIVE